MSAEFPRILALYSRHQNATINSQFAAHSIQELLLKIRMTNSYYYGAVLVLEVNG